MTVMEFDETLSACAELVRRADPDRFRATMAAPVQARLSLFPIYAFNAEVARAPWVTQESTIAEMRLQWWRDALEEIRAGEQVRRHEVVTPLAGVLDAKATALLDDLILARRWDIYREPFDDAAAFDAYLRQTSGHLMWVAARALGAEEEARSAVLDYGRIHGLSNLLRAIPALERAGRFPLVDGRSDAVRGLAMSALTDLKNLRPKLRRLPRPARAALLPAWQTAAILRRVRKSPDRVANGELEIAPMLSRGLMMWHAVTG